MSDPFKEVADEIVFELHRIEIAKLRSGMDAAISALAAIESIAKTNQLDAITKIKDQCDVAFRAISTLFNRAGGD